MCDNFKLKSACKDCPFKKGNGYLHPDRVKEIMSYMDEDKTFPCHKTVIHDDGSEDYSIMKEIQNEVEKLNLDNISKNLLLKEMYVEHGISRYVQDIENPNKICAGWLILGEKEGMLYNNFPLRFAAGLNLFNIEEYKNKDDVYDSIQEAVQSHKQNKC